MVSLPVLPHEKTCEEWLGRSGVRRFAIFCILWAVGVPLLFLTAEAANERA